MGKSAYVGNGQTLEVADAPVDTPTEVQSSPQQAPAISTSRAKTQSTGVAKGRGRRVTVGAVEKKVVTEEKSVEMDTDPTGFFEPRNDFSPPPLPTHQPSAHESPCAALINEKGRSGDASYTLRVLRVGTRRDKQVDEVLPIMTIVDLKKHLAANFGPGNWRIHPQHDGQALNEPYCLLQINIGEAECPAPAEESEDSNPLQNEKRRTQLLREKKLQMEAELDLKKTELEHKQLISGAADSPLQKTIDTLAKQIEDLKRANEKPQKTLGEQLLEAMPILTPLIAALAPLLKREKDTSMAEAIKEMSHQQERQADRQREQQKEFLHTLEKMNEKVLETVKEKSSKHGDILETIKVIRELNEEFSPPREEEFDIDPNNVTGSIVAGGIKALINAFRTGGPQIASAIAQAAAVLHKTPETLTQSDIPAIENELRRSLPNPQPLPPQVRRPAPMPRTTPAPIPFPQQPVPSLPPNPTVSLETPPPHQAEQAAVAVNPPERKPKTKEEIADLVARIEVSFDHMALDITSGRMIKDSFDWVEDAIHDWPDDYLAYLARIPNPVTRMSDISRRAQAKYDATVQLALAEGQTKYGSDIYTKFYQSFDHLIAAWTELQANIKAGTAVKGVGDVVEDVEEIEVPDAPPDPQTETMEEYKARVFPALATAPEATEAVPQEIKS